jgi:GntR family transcriptional regulator/MocR family aminotransferase
MSMARRLALPEWAHENGACVLEDDSDGNFAEHIRQTCNHYRAARDLLAESLVHASGGDAGVRVPDQGLHLVAILPQGLPAAAAERIRSAAGVEGRLLSETRILPGGPDGFVLDYSGHALPALKEAAQRLGRSVRAYHRRLQT